MTPWDLLCPASPDGIGSCSYIYRGCDLCTGVPDEMIIAYDRRPWHQNRRNILFADGSVTRPKGALAFRRGRKPTELDYLSL